MLLFILNSVFSCVLDILHELYHILLALMTSVIIFCVDV